MSRMVTTGSKLFFGIGGLALVAAVVSVWGSDGGLSGGLTFGLVGSVGDHLAVTVLGGLALVVFGLGGLTSAFRDADPAAVTEVARSERLPAAVPPRNASYWPALGAVAVVLAIVGFASSPGLVIVAAAMAGIVVIEWMVQAWSDRATGDPEANQRIRNRLMHPIEIPLFGAIGIGVVVFSVSRVLLSVSQDGSSIVAVAIALVVISVAALLSFRPELGRNLIVVVVALFAVGIITAGIIGAAAGPREFHPHEEEPTEEGLGAGLEWRA